MTTSKAGTVPELPVAAALLGSPPDLAAISLARELILSGCGKSVFDAVMAEAKSFSNVDDVLPRLMSSMERVMNADTSVGAYLMGRLYSTAAKTSHHEITEAIELWMNAISSEEAAGVVLKLADEGLRPWLRKRCHQWAHRMRERTEKA